MSDHDPFPNVKDKLTAPTKKSAFEKSRLEAEAKRLREEAETAAVLKDFVASFDDDDDGGPAPSSLPSSSVPGSGLRGGGSFRARTPGRRHFTAGPPRKRNLEAAFERDGGEEVVAGVFGGGAGAQAALAMPMSMAMGERDRGEREKRRARGGGGETGLLAWENSAPGGKGDDDSDSETSSKPHPKPTLSLTSLPPSTTKPILTALLASTPLRIDSIRIIPAPPPPGPSQPSPSIRKACSALITLSPETPSSDIDAAVTSLNGRYLGTGFWLTISRHLPSTISTATPLTTPTVNPFNAIAPAAPASSSSAHHRHHNHRPPPHRGGFAPPSSYRTQGTAAGTAPPSLQVHVHVPSDLRLLRLVHKTLEMVLKHGEAFEALLMASDHVRADPRFSWLWDARSPPGVYYRWKLWALVTSQRAQPAIEMFEPTPALSALWIPPRRPLRYEFAGSLADVRADEEFSREELLDDDDDGGGGATGEAADSSPPDGKRGYLGVLGRAKLAHLVARIPTATTRVRRGDVGRVMAFAMEHAEGGMGEEVVDVLVGNVLRPLAFTPAAGGEDANGNSSSGNEETHAAKIIGLWVISDVLSNSSLGIRNAWRYRQLFDVALRERGVFAHLGEVYRTPGWGRMKAEKFRRGVVEGVLEWWEKWCIFPQTTQDAFLAAFLTPPTTASSSSSTTAPAPSTTTAPTTTTSTNTSTPSQPAQKSKWKTVDAAPSSFNPHTATAADPDIDGQPMPDEDDDDDDDEDEDIDGEPMPDDDNDADAEPMQEDADAEPMQEDEEEDEDLKEMFDDGAAQAQAAPARSAGAPRKRMRAEELWADEE